MRNTPRVSIGMPVFNSAKFIEPAIRSILAQDYEDFELIISDNGSTDETESICRSFMAQDGRIRYSRNATNLGMVRNFNLVFEMSRGEYFRWAAYDDECHPSMIRRCVEVLDQAPSSTVMVYPLGELIDEQGNTLNAPLDRIESRDQRPHRRLAHLHSSLNMCDPMFGLIKSKYLRQTQVIGPFFGFDYVMLSELAMLGQIWELDEVLFRLRAHTKRSLKVHVTARQRAVLYDPKAAQKLFVLPSWEWMVLETLKSIGRSALPASEKLRCGLAVAGSHYWRRMRNVGGKWKRVVLAPLQTAAVRNR